MHIVAFVCRLFIMSSPVYFPVDPEPPVDQEYHYVTDDQYPSAELPGKQTPLIIPRSPILSSLILALDFAIVDYSVAPILMHSLLL